MDNSTQNGAPVPVKDDNNQLSAIKPHTNEGLYQRFRELKAFVDLVLVSLHGYGSKADSEIEVLGLTLSKLEDLADLYGQLVEAEREELADNFQKEGAK